MGFYVLVLTIFFANLNTLQPLGLQPYFAITLVVLGALFALILHNYRRWHNIYVNTAIVLQRLIYNHTPVTDATIRNEWAVAVQSYRIRTMSVEQLTFIGFLFITFLPLYVGSAITPVTALLHACYVVAGTYLSREVLKTETKQGYLTSWLLKLNSVPGAMSPTATTPDAG